MLLLFNVYALRMCAQPRDAVKKVPFLSQYHGCAPWATSKNLNRSVSYFAEIKNMLV